jgi:outer membrane receptor for ferrienterochelin and colicins
VNSVNFNFLNSVIVQSVRFSILMFTWLCLWAGNLHGQLVRGQVIDLLSREPLVGATAILDSTQGTITDSLGNFRLETSVGKHQISFSFIGYQDYTTSLTIKDTEVFLLIELKPEDSELGEVVVSAGKYQQRLEEVTVSLDVIKPNLVQDKNQVTLKNTLQQAPGVNVTDGQANIRSGSGWTYGAGTRVQTLVDGMPLISGDANQVQWDLVPIHSVERIEVLKGASSVLYGSAALNGVVNMLTHPFPEKEHFNVNLYSGTYDKPRRRSLQWWEQPQFNSGFNFDWQKPLSEHQALIFSGGYIDDQGFRYLDNEKRVRLFGKYYFRSKRIRNLQGSVAAHLMYSDVGNSLLWESDSLGYIPLDSSITRNYGWDYYLDGSLSYRHGRFRHNLQSRYLKINNITFDDQTDFTNRSDLIFGEYRLQYYISGLSASLGLSTSHTISDAVLFDGRHTSANNAMFLELDYRPWKPIEGKCGNSL